MALACVIGLFLLRLGALLFVFALGSRRHAFPLVLLLPTNGPSIQERVVCLEVAIVVLKRSEKDAVLAMSNLC